MGALKINVSDTSGQSWPLVLHQTLNQSSTGWGPGIKFLNAIDNSSKWAGIGGIASDEYANSNDLYFYTSATARYTMGSDAFAPVADNTYNLGQSALRWKCLYATKITADSAELSGYRALTVGNGGFVALGRGDMGTTYNIDALTTNSFFEVRGTNEVTLSGIRPFEGYYGCVNFHLPVCKMQIAGSNAAGFAIRGIQKANATLANVPWHTLLTSANYNSYSPTLTGGGASGTWGISITGNATTASSASWASGASYAERVAGYYTGNGGAQGPSYIGRGNVKFNMMNQFPNAGTTNYMDCILMNTYGGGDVPRATAFGIERYSGRAWIAEGSDTSSTWEHVYEVISTRNIASQSVNYATTAGQASTANRLTSTTALWGEPGTHDGKWVKICQETLGGWRNARLVLAISSRYQGTGIFSLTLDVNSAGLAPISGSLNYNGSCPYGISFKAYYNESTGNFTMWMLYNNYSQANITVLESYQWYSSIQYYGVWDTIPSDVGYEIGIKVNAGDTCHNFGANQPSGSAQVGALYYQTIG